MIFYLCDDSDDDDEVQISSPSLVFPYRKKTAPDQVDHNSVEHRTVEEFDHLYWLAEVD
jgi:hypothetical protein